MTKEKAALLLIDIQYDFLPALDSSSSPGSLAVTDGETILPHCYDLLDKGKWDLVVASQDYHPANHISFAATHDRDPFTTIQVPLPPTGKLITQVLWPIHCQQGTHGAEIEEGIKTRLEKVGGKVVQKGLSKERDDYSAFAVPLGEESKGPGELANLLGANKITRVFIVGLATDYCVRASVLSALESAAAVPDDWQVYIIEEGVKGVDPDQSKQVLKELEAKGAKLVSIKDEVVQAYLG